MRFILFFSFFLRNRSWCNVAKQLMVCQPESTPKMSWPHKTHLALLAGPYLVTNIESDEWFLSMESEFFQSFLTYERASLPACQSLQGWCRWARVVPSLLLVGGQTHLFLPQGLHVGATLAGQFWCLVTFPYYQVDWPSYCGALYFQDSYRGVCQGVHFPLWKLFLTAQKTWK